MEQDNSLFASYLHHKLHAGRISNNETRRSACISGHSREHGSTHFGADAISLTLFSDSRGLRHEYGLRAAGESEECIVLLQLCRSI